MFADHQGTPVGSILNTNWPGGITRTRTDPYGAARSAVTGTGGHGFLAATVDTTGLVSLGARYYDPDGGRFVSVDPVLSPLNTAQFNAYDYAGNNPLTWSDASGLDFWGDVGKNISGAWNAAGKWVKQNASTLVGIAAGGLVTAGCLALTGGAGSVGCFVAGGMVGGAVTNLYKTVVEKKKFSLNSFVSDVAWGGAAGLLGPIAGAVGKALAPAAKTLIASLTKPVQALVSRVGTAAKSVATPQAAATTTGSRLAGSGPVPGVLEASARVKSIAALRSYTPPRGGVEYVFDPASATFAVGRPSARAGLTGSPHQQLAQSIGADPTRVCRRRSRIRPKRRLKTRPPRPDWVGDLIGRLGVDSAARRGRCSAAAGGSRSRDRTGHSGRRGALGAAAEV